jgi:hypothetical protein
MIRSLISSVGSLVVVASFCFFGVPSQVEAKQVCPPASWKAWKTWKRPRSRKPVPKAFRMPLKALLKEYEAGKPMMLVVAVHTNSRGSSRFNLVKSKRAADGIGDYLKGRGFPASRLVAKGYGEMCPIATIRTRSGRARNKRVVFYLRPLPKKKK